MAKGKGSNKSKNKIVDETRDGRGRIYDPVQDDYTYGRTDQLEEPPKPGKNTAIVNRF